MTNTSQVDAQLDAFNRHDVAAFVACYSRDVVMASLTGGEILSGATAMTEYYEHLFAERAGVKAILLTRTVVGAMVSDLELIEIDGEPPRQSLVIYRVADSGLITHFWFVR